VYDNKEWFQEMARFALLGIAVVGAVGSAGYVNRRPAPSAGTTVHAYVPKHLSAQQASSGGDPAVGDSGGVLLIVDDNEDPRILAQHGCLPRPGSMY
jgi:hypothetical protein